MNWPQIPDARLIRTLTFHNCGEFLEQTAARRGLGLFYGHPGVGKSHTLDHHARRLGIRVLEAQRNQRLTGLIEWMYAVTGVTPPPGRLPRQSQELLDGLREPVTVVIDNADRLGLDLCRFLGALVTEDSRKLAVGLVGTPAFERRLREAQAVRAAINTWKVAPALSLDDVVATLPRYHSIWADANPLMLRRINTYFAHGFFGRWAVATEQALELRPDPAAVPWSSRLVGELLRRLKERR